MCIIDAMETLSRSSIGIVRDPLYHRHENGPRHPERPARLEAVDRAIERFEYRDRLQDIEARDADHEELARVHSAAYIDRIADTRRRNVTYLDPDTSAGPWSYTAALRAAGGCIAAVDAVLDRSVDAAFAFPRPPGHHAEPERAMGFCLFNSVAVAAAHAVAARGLARVAIFDWDVHHGNGTMSAFYESPDVLFISVHQSPLFPGTGAVEETGRGDGEGYTVNIPLPAGRGDEDYLEVLQRLVLPALRRFKPELLLVSAGFDADYRDPLAGMRLSSEAFGSLTTALLDCAVGELGAAPVFVLEGGYSLEALEEGTEHVLRALLGERYRTAPTQASADDGGSARRGGSSGGAPSAGGGPRPLERVISEVRRAQHLLR